jgi:tetratricopeptide (TPR) repeat protein
MAMEDNDYDEVVKGALKAIKKYPGKPKFHRILQFAYRFDKQYDKADAAIAEEYRLYPGYLLAKIAYANMLIFSDSESEFPAIFNNKADLDEIYPDRKVFSYEEAAAFYACMCRYFTNVGDIDSADKYMNAIIKNKLLDGYGHTILRPAIEELCQAKMDKLTEATS